MRDVAGGVYTTPLDLARFGYLFLNKGQWDGKQVISEEWVAEATKVHVPNTMPGRDDSPRQESLSKRSIGRYGYNWWLNTIAKDGKRIYPDAPANLFFASGYNNNKCFIIPEWNMVIVRMGVKGAPQGANNIWNEFLRMIGKAIP